MHKSRAAAGYRGSRYDSHRHRIFFALMHAHRMSWQHSVDRLRGGKALLDVDMIDHTLHALFKICLGRQKGSGVSSLERINPARQ